MVKTSSIWIKVYNVLIRFSLLTCFIIFGIFGDYSGHSVIQSMSKKIASLLLSETVEIRSNRVSTQQWDQTLYEIALESSK